MALVVGVLAGFYPAVFLSRYRPAEVLKGHFRSGRSGRGLRKALVVVQFAASVALLVGTLVVYQQLRYVQTSRLGFDTEQVVVVPVQDPVVRQHYAALREAWAQQAEVVAVGTSSSSYPGKPHASGWTVQRDGASDEEAVTMYRNWVDPGFFDALGVEWAAGRGFSDTAETDGEAVVLNEAAVRALGWRSPEAALGETVALQGEARAVVGVVQDYHFQSLHHRIAPLVLTLQRHTPTNVLVRLRATDLAAALASLQASWEDVASGQPFTYSFLDDTVEALYRADTRWGQVVGYAAALAMLIACLGLFGLAAFSAEARTKEIGVRKALGASVSGIVLLLSKEFLKLVLVAFLVAVPLAYAAMNQWLNNFAYRVEISWPIFLMAGLVALLVALLTVSYQAIRAALADPVKALRYE
jgi:putative ABC transport system permease protein